jgi:UTP--glucose-1-phosphate uridylyltransferase
VEELMQNESPKVSASLDHLPISWPLDAELEWCPPGHGDLFAALLGSGLLHKLLAAKVKYLFVSNSDNLGATLDERLLREFAQSDMGMLMEVAQRTEADKKGGHLCKLKTGGLSLRESAMCPKSDIQEFQNVKKHQFFNTNNIWFNLEQVLLVMNKNNGIMPLPLIKNAKTVDPRNAQSPGVLQLETAMGAAISEFATKATAIVVPRSRFAPVKTCGDLFLLRSDVYQLGKENYRMELIPGREVAPMVNLDDVHYKLVDQMDKLVKVVPSMKDCGSLTVKGPVLFEEEGVVIKGHVVFEVQGTSPKVVKSGTYDSATIILY